MIDINAFSFLLFDMLIFSLSVAAFRDLKLQSRFHNYWRLSLVFFAVGYFCFAISPYVNNRVETLANYCVVMASVSMTLLMRTWNTPVTKRLELWIWGLSLLIPLGREYLLEVGTHQHRVTFVMSILFALSLWRIHELTKLQKREPNTAIKIMLVLALIYSVLSFMRIVIVWLIADASNVKIYSEGLVAVVNRWGLSATHVMTYLAINEYYTEKSWLKEKQVLEEQLNSQKIIEQLAREVNETTQLNKDLAYVLAEKNKLLTSLSSSMKSTRMGAMASSLAHEINQPLSAIRLNAEMALSELDKLSGAELAHTNLKYLIEDADRIDSIVNKIKKFFYNDYSDFKHLKLADLVDSTFDYVLDDCKKHGIDVMVNVDPMLTIYGDQGQLQMVVFNLVRNAMDALDASDGVRCITVSSVRENPYISLVFEDSGSGVPQDVMGDIFELFRTTKPEGMGVGLWLSRAVMENHRGHLNFSNRDQGGARFVMQFPAPAAQP